MRECLIFSSRRSFPVGTASALDETIYNLKDLESNRRMSVPAISRVSTADYPDVMMFRRCP